jgi:ATP phosphoribosyltransferase
MMITIGIGSGKGFQQVAAFFKLDKNSTAQDFYTQAIPIFIDAKNNIRFVRVRHRDLPNMLDKKIIDFALGNGMWFLETPKDNCTCLQKLHLRPCRIALISHRATDKHAIQTIGTRFIHLGTSLFPEKNIHYIEGADEVFLLLNQVDAILDIIETGKTIEKLNLEELETIGHFDIECWARKDTQVQKHKVLEKYFGVLQPKM